MQEQQSYCFVKENHTLHKLFLPILIVLSLVACQPRSVPKEVPVAAAKATTVPVQTETAVIPIGITPVRIVIPSIRVDAPIAAVGLTEEGAMEVPKETDVVGWFAPGVNPGAAGNAVLAGHVDSYIGPAVFYSLKKLVPGDEVFIYGEKGEELRFVVAKKQSYPYNDAPLEEIFGYTSSQQLNLITCTGRYDRKITTHTERLVVYTVLQ